MMNGFLMYRKTTALFRAAIVIALAASLAGCASRPGPSVLNTVTAVPGAKQVKIYAATTRSRIQPQSNEFDATKSVNANYGELTISIPPGHKPSMIEWPGDKPDAAKSFAVVGQSVLDRQSFINDIKANAAGKDIGLFVHGYNSNFQESLFRLAQITADGGLSATPVLFSWPSQGAFSGYVADKEAATYSRDYLADLLVELSQASGKGEVYVFAHSMGGWLTVEALRQLRLEGRDDVLARMNVILAAPDIDADVFRTQMKVIGKLKQPIRILVASDDRALAVSRYISSSSQRVGTLDVKDPAVQAAAVESGVEIIDISGITPTDSARHSRFVDAKLLFPALNGATQNRNGLTTAGAFVFDAAAATVSSPFRLVSGVLRQGE